MGKSGDNFTLTTTGATRIVLTVNESSTSGEAYGMLLVTDETYTEPSTPGGGETPDPNPGETTYDTLYMRGTMNSWNAPGVALTTTNGVYTYDVTSTEEIRFKLSTVNDDGWGSYDNGVLGVGDGDTSLEANHDYTLSSGKKGDNVLSPGTYTIKITANNGTYTLRVITEGGNQGGETPNPDPNPGETVSSVRLMGLNNDWTTGMTGVDVDGCAKFVVKNWAEGTGFKFKDGNTWYGYVGEVENDKWYATGETGEGGNITLPASATGKTVTLNFAHNNHNFSAHWDASNQGGGETPDPDRPVTGLSGTLPVLYINVYNADGTSYNNEIIDKDLADKNYRSGEYWLDLNDCQWALDKYPEAASVGSKDAPLPLEIKARGNFTRKGFSKKPFKLKLGKKQNLLGMNVNATASKHWAILAAADDDYGYLRNYVGFDLGERIGLPWTPRQFPIEVVINGDYRGLYFLTESIRVGDGRVPITELKDEATDVNLISGGYLIEMDNYDDEVQVKFPEDGRPNDGYGNGDDWIRVTANTPEIYSEVQRRFVEEQFRTMNSLVYDRSNDLWKYLELDDAARYYVVMEIISHWEAYHGSTYVFRDRGEGQKWHFSPLWDCGNAFSGSTNDYFYNCAQFGNNWIKAMNESPMFQAKVQETWKWFMTNCYDGLMADIDDFASHVKKAAEADYARWHGAPQPTHTDEVTDTRDVVDNRDMTGRASAVKNHLNAKINWLKGRWGDYADGGTYNEPARDNTPAAPLPYYVDPSYVPNYVYVYNDANWSNIHAFIYNDTNNGEYPGKEITEFVADLVYTDANDVEYRGLYRMEIPYELRNARIIFSEKNGSHRYPADGVPGMEYNGTDIIFFTSWTEIKPNPAISVYIPSSHTLPLVKITTNDNAKVKYGEDVAATFELKNLGLEGVTAIAPVTCTVKGRGAEQWNAYQKKSYKITFDKKQEILGIPKSKHYVLMSYTEDAANGLLTNYAAHEVSRMIGMSWTPLMQPVEVVLNGDYLGLYFIAENVRVDDNRISIKEYGKKTYDIDNHMILEFTDSPAEGESVYSFTAGGATHHVVPESPDFTDAAVAADPAVLTAVTTQVNALADATAAAAADPASKEWKELIDFEQAARYYVVQEIMDCSDAYTDNLYMWHGDAGTKWNFGPVWNFSASPMTGYKNELIHTDANKGIFIGDLYKNNLFRLYTVLTFVKFVNGEYPALSGAPSFKAVTLADVKGATEDIYNPTLPGNINDVYTNVADMSTRIATAAEYDAARWPEYASATEAQPMSERTNAVINRIRTNVAYLASTADGAPGWDFEKVVTGVENVTVEGTDEAPIYFDLTGRRIAAPATGNIYIIRRGDNVTKEIAR